jgi:ribosomal protein L11 methylase PrmA
MGPGYKLSQQRSAYRLNFIFQGLEAVIGGSIKGRSVADIACNWGGFSIEAHLRGASHVLGFDIRPENIAKARRVARHFDADAIDFQVQDLFTHKVQRTHDVVLNLGLMYHISMPFEMMKKTYEMTGEVAVIDTIVHREAFSGLILGTGEAAVDHAATAIGVELHPTYRGLIDLAYMVGFKEVIELHGLPGDDWPDFATNVYGTKNRRCIVAFK